MSHTEDDDIEDDNPIRNDDTVPGFVYVITDSDDIDANEILVKIGIVTGNRSVESRMAEHQTGNPRKLVEIFRHASQSPRILERHVHRTLIEKRTIGEWFRPTLSEIETLHRDIRDVEKHSVPRYVELNRLATEISYGTLPRSPEMEKLIGDYRALSKDIYDEKVLQDEIRASLIDAAQGYSGIREIVEIAVRPRSLQFRTYLQTDHPELLQSFTVQRLTDSGLKVKGVKDTVSTMEDRVTRKFLKGGLPRPDLIKPIGRFFELNSSRIESLKRMKALQSDREWLADELKLRLGPYSEYEGGDAKWIRKIGSKFDSRACQKENACIFEDFRSRVSSELRIAAKFVDHNPSAKALNIRLKANLSD